MGKGGKSNESEVGQEISWDEVRKHSKDNDKWIVIDNQVYDVSQFARRHPGGSRIIGHYAGQDASEAFKAFHTNMGKVSKYMTPLNIGSVGTPCKVDEEEIRKDFIQLRKKAEEMNLFEPSKVFFLLIVGHLIFFNLFEPSKVFFLLIVGHLIFFEVLAFQILNYFGTNWLPYLASIACYVIVQSEAGWSQHDFGHLSVFKSNRLNRIMHSFVMNCLKGASTSWWQHLHNQHHSKPNVINKDPDVRLEQMFVLGEEMPKRIAKEKKRSLPYNWQHRYFFAIGPPLLFPIYFQYMIFKHPITRRNWIDVILMTTFYFKILFLYSPMLGVFGAIKYYFLVRCLESHWFVWVSQSNHIPMEIDDDKERPWLSLQLHATCDVEKSFFNDWFTGHLNFQIEHHLFPTMPRHNLYKIKPYVVDLCEKHGIPYQCKTLSEAFLDIVKSLKHSGEIWYAYYQSYHLS